MKQAIHHIDLLFHLVGDIEYVLGFGNTRFIKNKYLGVIGDITATQPKDYESSITIMGDKGTLKIGGFAFNKISYFKNIYNTELNLKKINNN
jgi:UDP-N-acetyl-2-amino-2-deoxyglucuronate dehydrogenase